MTYRPSNRSLYGRRRWWLAGVVLIPAFILWWWWASFAALAANLVRPIWEIGRAPTTTENEAALRLPALLGEVRRLTDENTSLRRALGRFPDPAERPVLGRVISHPLLSPYDTLIADIGAANSGPRPNIGNAVLVDGSFLGTVSAVGPTTVQVELASAPGHEWPVRLGDRVPAIARGRGAGNFSAEMAPGLLVNPGELVALTVNERSFNLGVVDRTGDSGSSVETIYFRSPVNLDELRWVEIYAR